MCDWLKKVNWKRAFLAAVIYLVIATVVRQVEAFLTMGYYLDPNYFSVWSKVMMPAAGPPPTSFYLISALFTFATGLVLVVFYEMVKQLLAKGFIKRSVDFTIVVSVLMLVFSTLPMYLIINLPLGLMATWLVSGVLITFLTAMVFVKVMK